MDVLCNGREPAGLVSWDGGVVGGSRASAPPAGWLCGTRRLTTSRLHSNSRSCREKDPSAFTTSRRPRSLVAPSTHPLEFNTPWLHSPHVAVHTQLHRNREPYPSPHQPALHHARPPHSARLHLIAPPLRPNAHPKLCVWPLPATAPPFACSPLHSIMADVAHSTSAHGSTLRERLSAKPLHLHNPDDARQTVVELNGQEARHQKHGPTRTYGRTPDGTGTLTRPQSHGPLKCSPRATQ